MIEYLAPLPSPLVNFLQQPQLTSCGKTRKLPFRGRVFPWETASFLAVSIKQIPREARDNKKTTCPAAGLTTQEHTSPKALNRRCPGRVALQNFQAPATHTPTQSLASKGKSYSERCNRGPEEVMYRTAGKLGRTALRMAPTLWKIWPIY